MTEQVLRAVSKVLSGSTSIANSGDTKDVTEVLLGLGEGPIGGPLNGLKSLYMGTTALKGTDGTMNYKDVWCSFFPGEEDEDSPTMALGGTASSQTVGVTLEDDVTVTRYGTGYNIDYLEVRIVVNELIRTNGKSAKATWEIYYQRSDDSDWTAFGTTALKSYSGKIMSATSLEYRQAVDNLDDVTYNVKVVPVTCSSTSSRVRSIEWESFIELTSTEQDLTTTAALQLGSRASSQYSDLPTIWGEYGGLYCHVPSNYDVDERTYDGTWDGTFTMAVTDDPAWIMYEIVVNTTWGYASVLPDVTMNKWDCYAASLFYSTQVSDGTDDGTQPRYTFNEVLTTASSGMSFLNSIAAQFFSYCYDDGTGTIRLVYDDCTAEACALFGDGNIRKGSLHYSSTAVSSRNNYMKISYPDPDMQWAAGKVVISDSDQIDLNGKIPQDVSFGDCTDRHEATRRGWFRLISACTETEMVSLETNRAGFNLTMFDVFLVADPDMEYGQSDRIKTISDDRLTITFLNAISVESGVSYTVQVPIANDLFSTTFTASATESVTTITLDDALDDSIVADFPFTVGGPRPYRLIDIQEVDGNPDYYRLTGICINRQKQTGADECEYVEDGTWSSRDSGLVVAAPTDLTLSSKQYTTDGSTYTTIYIGWTASTSTGISYYEVYYSLDGGSKQLLTQTSSTSCTIDVTTSGTYEFFVCAYNTLVTSDYLDGSIAIDITTATVSSVTGLEIKDSSNSTEFETADVTFSWNETDTTSDDLDDDTAADSQTTASTTRYYQIRIYDTDSVEQYSTTTTDTEFTFTYALNAACSDGPYREFTIGVAKVDTYGNISSEVTLTVSNPAPSAPTTISTVTGTGSVVISWTAVTDTDVAGYLVYASDDASFTPSDDTLVQSGTDCSYQDTSHPGDTMYYYIAAYDLFGTDDLTYSTLITVDIPAITSSELADHTITAEQLTEDMATVSVYGADDDLPTEYVSQYIYWESDGQLYQWDSDTSAYEQVVSATNLAGEITEDQIADGSVSGTKLASGLEAVTVVTSVPTTYTTASIYDSTDGTFYTWDGTEYVSIDEAITADDFASTIEPVTLVTSTPTTYSTYAIYNTTSGELLTWNGSSYESVVAGEITSTEISDSAITTPKLAANAVTAAKIAANTITAGCIAAGAITTTQIAASTITGDDIASETITADNIAAETITAGLIAAGAISTDQLAADAVTADKIASETIVADNIAASTITGDNIASETITADNLAADCITAGKIAAGAITSDAIAAGAITADAITSGTLDVDTLILANALTEATYTNLYSGTWTTSAFTTKIYSNDWLDYTTTAKGMHIYSPTVSMVSLYDLEEDDCKVLMFTTFNFYSGSTGNVNWNICLQKGQWNSSTSAYAWVNISKTLREFHSNTNDVEDAHTYTMMYVTDEPYSYRGYRISITVWAANGSGTTMHIGQSIGLTTVKFTK